MDTKSGAKESTEVFSKGTHKEAALSLLMRNIRLGPILPGVVVKDNHLFLQYMLLGFIDFEPVFVDFGLCFGFMDFGPCSYLGNIRLCAYGYQTLFLGAILSDIAVVDFGRLHLGKLWLDSTSRTSEKFVDCQFAFGSFGKLFYLHIVLQ